MILQTRAWIFRAGVRQLSKATNAAAEAARASTFPYVPLLAVALSAPIVGFKSGVLDAEQLPEKLKAVLDDADKASGGLLRKFVLSPGPPAPRAEPLIVPNIERPAATKAAAASAAPGDMKRYLDEHKHAIVGLLFHELAAVQKKESWVGLLYQPLTMWRLRNERLAILEQLACRDART